MWLVKYILLGVCLCRAATSENTDVPSESEEFFEVDVRKLISNNPIEFGTGMHGGNATRYERLLSELGPVYKTAYWSAVWEVSGAAPAPRESDDDTMERWVASIYWNIAQEFGNMENTTKMLLGRDIQYIAATTTAPNTYYATSYQIRRAKELDAAAKEGINIDAEIDWTQEAEKAKADNDQMFMSEYLNDFAKFWATSMVYLEERKIHLPYIEMMWEPDSTKFMYMSPSDYVAFLKQTKKEMGARNIPEDRHKIVGPGTSRPSAAAAYIEKIVEDKEVYDMIHAWSVHLRDNGQSLHEIEREIQHFRQSIKALVPSSWEKKPIIVTSFQYRPTNNEIFEDVVFNGDMDFCYYKLYSQFRIIEDFIPNSIAQSPTTGVRLLASLFLQFSHGFSKSIYESLTDHAWSHDCAGMFDRMDRRKQIFVAFSTFLPYIEKDSVAIRRQWKNFEDCFIVAVKSKTRIIFAVANPGNSPCSRSFSLSGVNINKLNDAFTVSYNNGTVSLAATEPSEALVLKQPLSYDVFPSEDEGGKDVIEFDVVVGPGSSASAILDLKATARVVAQNSTSSEEEAAKPSHSEL